MRYLRPLLFVPGHRDRLCAAIGIGVPAKTIEAELGLGPQDMGLVMGTWYWLYALCQLPSGWLIDRLGSRLGLIAFMIVWSALTGIVGLATGFPLLLLLWGAMGAAQSGMFPCASKSIGALFPPAGRAIASGSLGCCMSIGWMISPLIADCCGYHTWQNVFVFYAVPGFAWALVYAMAQVPTKGSTKQSAGGLDEAGNGPADDLSLLAAVLSRPRPPRFSSPGSCAISPDEASMKSAPASWPSGPGSAACSAASSAESAATLLRLTGNSRLSRQGQAATAMSLATAFMTVAYFAESDVRTGRGIGGRRPSGVISLGSAGMPSRSPMAASGSRRSSRP